MDAWVKRYESGESVKQIAGGEFSPVTVFHHLRKRGVKLRDKVEAQIEAVTKHERKSFSGSDSEPGISSWIRMGRLQCRDAREGGPDTQRNDTS